MIQSINLNIIDQKKSRLSNYVAMIISKLKKVVRKIDPLKAQLDNYNWKNKFSPL